MIKSLLAELSLLDIKGSTCDKRLNLEVSKDTWNLYVGKTLTCGGLLKKLPVVKIEMIEIDTFRASPLDELWKMIQIDSKKNK